MKGGQDRKVLDSLARLAGVFFYGTNHLKTVPGSSALDDLIHSLSHLVEGAFERAWRFEFDGC